MYYTEWLFCSVSTVSHLMTYDKRTCYNETRLRLRWTQQMSLSKTCNVNSSCVCVCVCCVWPEHGLAGLVTHWQLCNVDTSRVVGPGSVLRTDPPCAVLRTVTIRLHCTQFTHHITSPYHKQYVTYPTSSWTSLISPETLPLQLLTVATMSGIIAKRKQKFPNKYHNSENLLCSVVCPIW